MKYTTQAEITGKDIRKVRNKLKLTQKEFAELLNVNTSTVEKWEKKVTAVKGVIAFAIQLLDNHVGIVSKIEIPEPKFPLRLYYMLDNQICTIIDVDERSKQVKVYNYKEDDIYTAFGKIENPTYHEYEEFLESRCFPRNRDNIKLILKDLNIPFYDPILIIEKTKGKMAEDNFWIKMEGEE